ncbi:hypothetical protein [Rhizobium sp. WYJ-E13]|jgi:hypothetical protein|nr:hypothetical protein [Rhizobium sp. WYJ-E13]QWW71509.1 hypothetical protein KQ933_23015 [Rhizobium sp. WYJ-E13]
MGRDIKIVLVATIGALIVCTVCFALWASSAPYRPQWDFPGERGVSR